MSQSPHGARVGDDPPSGRNLRWFRVVDRRLVGGGRDFLGQWRPFGGHRADAARGRGMAKRRPTRTRNQPVVRRAAGRIPVVIAGPQVFAGVPLACSHAGSIRVAAVRRISAPLVWAIFSISAGFIVPLPSTRLLVTRVRVTRSLVKMWRGACQVLKNPWLSP